MRALLTRKRGLRRYWVLIIFFCLVSPPTFAIQLSRVKVQEATPQSQHRTGRIDTPLDTDNLIEDLSKGATFRLEIAPKLPLFTFKIIPNVRDDESRFPQSTVQDIEVFKGDFQQPLQHLTGCDFDQMQPPQRYGDWFHTADINFDGYQDIYLMTTYGATGNHYGCIWLYNPATGKFDYSKEFSQLSRYWLDPTSKTIRTFDRAGMAGMVFVANKYKVKNDRPVLIWSAKQDWDGGKFHCVEQERRNGKMLTTQDVLKNSGEKPPCYIPLSWFQTEKNE